MGETDVFKGPHQDLNAYSESATQLDGMTLRLMIDNLSNERAALQKQQDELNEQYLKLDRDRITAREALAASKLELTENELLQKLRADRDRLVNKLRAASVLDGRTVRKDMDWNIREKQDAEASNARMELEQALARVEAELKGVENVLSGKQVEHAELFIALQKAEGELLRFLSESQKTRVEIPQVDQKILKLRMALEKLNK